MLEGTIDQEALRNYDAIITKNLKKLGYQLGDDIQIGRFNEVMKGKNSGHRFKTVGIIGKMPVCHLMNIRLTRTGKILNNISTSTQSTKFNSILINHP